MSLNVGIDLVEVEQVGEALAIHGERYLRRVYTAAECADSRCDPARLAARFAAKEATMKALRRGDEAIPWRSIELRRDGGGRPSLRLSGPAAELAARRGVSQFAVSLTHERGCAAAVVVADGRP